jgi:hypothetical protein
MDTDKVEFLVRQHIRSQVADGIGRRIEENLLPPLLRVCGKPRNMPARAHHEPPRFDGDRPAARLPLGFARVNDNAPGLDTRHHGLG